ncbi:hypothetical protein T08_8427, partial [Trichinella sp. T8]
LAGTFRNQPVRLLFCRNPFLGLFFTIGFILLPYVGHQLDKKGKFILSVFCNRKKGFNAPTGLKFLYCVLYLFIFIFVCFNSADERKRSHSNGEVQFERDYHYLKHHLFHSWEKNNHYTADGNEHIDLVVLAYRISVFHYIGVTPTLAFCGAQIRMLVDVIYGIP